MPRLRPERPTRVDIDVIDAEGCVVTPVLIDPHEHLLGGSGEQGFATQTPEITLGEFVSCGITTVVGCLGVDTAMKNLPGLLAKVKGLREEGLSADMWSGGYNVPPARLHQGCDCRSAFRRARTARAAARRGLAESALPRARSP